MPKSWLRNAAALQLTAVRAGTLQRQCACGTHTAGGAGCGKCGSRVSPVVNEALEQTGRPLDSITRAGVERGFGRDFSHVRVHTGEAAALSAKALGAQAYSVGSDIVFGGGQYAPSTSSGKSLLAHELAHTIQQPSRTRGADLTTGDAASAAEREAQHAAKNIGSSGTLSLRPSPLHVVHRQAAAAEKRATPADYGITLAVVDHGAKDAAGAAYARVQEIYSHVQGANLAELKMTGITKIEMHVIPEGVKLTELPEFAYLKGKRTHDGRLYDDIRGVGGEQVGTVIRYAVAQEELVGSKSHTASIGFGIGGGVGLGALGAFTGYSLGGKDSKKQLLGGVIGGAIGAIGGAIAGFFGGRAMDRDTGYASNFAASHETAHTVELFALPLAQHQRLQKIYDARLKAGGPWLDPADYTKSTIHEYWAQCSAAFFRRPYQDSDADTYTPEWLQKNDPDMYQLLVEVYGTPPAQAGKQGSAETPRMEKAAA